MNRVEKLKKLNQLKNKNKKSEKIILTKLSEYRVNYLFNLFIYSSVIYLPLFYFWTMNLYATVSLGLLTNILFAAILSIVSLSLFGKEKKYKKTLFKLEKKIENIKQAFNQELDLITEKDIAECFNDSDVDDSLGVDILDAYEKNKGLNQLEDTVLRSFDYFTSSKSLTVTTEESLRELKKVLIRDLKKSKKANYKLRMNEIVRKNKNKILNE